MRRDLTPGQQVAQVGHAIVEFISAYADSTEWRNETLVVVGVDNRFQLEAGMLHLACTEWVIEWREPDMNNELTAFAVLPHDETKMKAYSLL